MSDTCQHGPGYIISPQSPGERKKPHLIQMPPRTFSHRSSPHVITLTRNLGAQGKGLCIVPRLYSQRMAFYLCKINTENSRLRFSRYLQSMTLASYIHTVSNLYGSLRHMVIKATLYLLLYLPLSRLPIIPGQVAGILLGLDIISTLSVFILRYMVFGREL